MKIKFNSGLDISDICPVYYTRVVFDKRPCFFLLYVPAAPFVPATAAAVAWTSIQQDIKTPALTITHGMGQTPSTEPEGIAQKWSSRNGFLICSKTA